MKKAKTLIIKSLIYRAFSFFTTWFVIFLLTPEVELTISIYITIIVEVFKTINYIIFHKLWDYYDNRRRKVL